MYNEGYGADQVIHDHFAFRTFGVPGLGIEPLGAALEEFGYKLRDFYTFPRTHLLAAWYAPPKDLYEVLPRMFVSQLQVSNKACRWEAFIDPFPTALGLRPACANGRHAGFNMHFGIGCRSLGS